MLVTASAVARHSDRGDRRKASLDGVLEKSRDTVTVVPRRRLHSPTSRTSPASARTNVPAPSTAAVSISIAHTDAMAASASPRKPNVPTPTRSSVRRIFEVA
jgi:hypothetical protein